MEEQNQLFLFGVDDSNYFFHAHHSEDSLMEVDTFVRVKGNDSTIIVEKTDKEYKLLEKIIEKEDYGKNIFLILISVFIIYSIIRKRNG